MKLSEVLARMIPLAEEIRAFWDAELPKRHPDYPLIRSSEDSGPPPPQEEQLKAFMATLPPDDIYKLIAIMYLGRGDYDPNDLASFYGQMKVTFPRAELAAAQMLGKGLLAEYLAEGVERLREAGIDVNKLPVKAAKARR